MGIIQRCFVLDPSAQLELLKEARRAQSAVYLATDGSVAKDISRILGSLVQAVEDQRYDSEELDRLEGERIKATRVAEAGKPATRWWAARFLEALNLLGTVSRQNACTVCTDLASSDRRPASDAEAAIDALTLEDLSELNFASRKLVGWDKALREALKVVLLRRNT